ncbi:MAG: ATP-binding protein [Burkholderiales bacterium]
MSQSTPSGDVRDFPARFAAVADTAAFALEFCGRRGIGRQAASRLRLVIEELFTNSVQHGYGGECDKTVRIALAMIDGYLTLQYEDSAPRYDPLQRLSTLPPDLVAALDAPPTDGLGVYLVGKLAYGARYEYEDGRNRLWLVMPP